MLAVYSAEAASMLARSTHLEAGLCGEAAMGMSKVGGWFLVGLVLPACVLFIGMILASNGTPVMLSLPSVVMFFLLFWGLIFLLSRLGHSSHYYDPRHAHRLFTPYYDE